MSSTMDSVNAAIGMEWMLFNYIVYRFSAAMLLLE
ncbi:unnamed protein product [Camellia sinensis]